MKAVSDLTQSQLSVALKKASRAIKPLRDEMIAAGRGADTVQVILMRKDGLSLRYIAAANLLSALTAEKERRNK